MGSAGKVFRVAATYVGTVVGAGFASGQEALRFFAAYGAAGLWGLLLATVLFAVLGAAIMHAGRALNARSHREVLHHALGPRLGPAADAAVTAFLFAALAIMLAGGGAIAAEHLGVPQSLGVLCTAGLTVITILAGLRGIMAANALVVPALTAAVLALTAAALWHHLPDLTMRAADPGTGAAPHWAWAACLYAGYNLMLSIPVLAPLGAAVPERRLRTWGAVTGAVVLGLLGMALHLGVGLHLPEAGRYQVPMLYLARFHPPPVQWLFVLVLWAEIYTTAIASAFGLARRLVPGGEGPFYRRAAVGAVALALAGGGFGFGPLVATLYPLFGYASLIMLGALGRAVWRGRR